MNKKEIDKNLNVLEKRRKFWAFAIFFYFMFGLVAIIIRGFAFYEALYITSVIWGCVASGCILYVIVGSLAYIKVIVDMNKYSILGALQNAHNVKEKVKK